MSGEVVPIGAGSGSHLATVTLWRTPDGSISARLEEMPPHVIEQHDTISERFMEASGWCLGAAESFIKQAVQFDAESQEGRA